ncbi:unnamed protein product, partial [Mesorhabditis spiculigera]
MALRDQALKKIGGITATVWLGAPCDDEWLYSSKLKSCYKLIGDFNGFTWETARNDCMSLGSDLASIHSAEEHRVVVGLADTYVQLMVNGVMFTKAATWIGGRRTGPNRTDFAWSNGSPFDFTNWAGGQPDNYGGDQEYVQIITTVVPGHFAPTDVCKFTRADAMNYCKNFDQKGASIHSAFDNVAVLSQARRQIADTTASGPPCDDQWTYAAALKKCYRVIGDYNGITWDKAHGRCRAMGGDLASIHSRQEHDIITDLVDTDVQLDAKSHMHTTSHTWIGGSRYGAGDRDFSWSDGTSFNYTQWAVNQPDNYRGHQNRIQIITTVDPALYYPV